MEEENPYGKHKRPVASTSAAPVADENPYGTHKKPAPKKESYTFGEAVRTGIANMGKGAYEFGSAIRDVYNTPVRDTLYNLASGTIDTAEAAKSITPEKAWKMIQDVGGVYKRRYTSYEQFKKDFAEHPYQIINDLVTVVTLPVPAAAAARAGQVASTVGRAAGAVGSAVVPARVAAAARTGANAVRGVAQSPFGTVAGIAGQAVVAPTRLTNRLAAGVRDTVVPSVATRIDRISDPIHYRMNEAVGGVANAGNMQRALSTTPRARVPGDVPTPASLITSQMDAPGIAGLQRQADSLTGAGTARAAAQTNAARNIIESIRGGTAVPIDQRINDFITQRSTNARRNYGRSDNDWMQMTPDMERDLNLPFNNQVLDQAVDIQRQNLNTFGAPAAYNIAAIGPLGTYNRLGTPVPTPGLRMISGEDADLMKKGMDTIASNRALPAGAQRGVRDTRSRFVGDARAAMPSYATSLDDFAADSALIDSTTYAQGLSDSLLNTAAGDNTVFANANAFASMRNNAMDRLTGQQAIQRSTGEPRYPRGERSLLQPAESASLDNVQDMFSREASVGQQTRGFTPESIADMESRAFSFGSLTPILGPSIRARNEILKRRLAEEMRTPEGLERLIASYAQKQQLNDDIAATYGFLTNDVNRFNPLRVMNNSPALYNPLMMQEDQTQPRNALVQ